jgi:hypothetical protein
MATQANNSPPATRNPERTQERILAAAIKEFVGARVDTIARRAAIPDQLRQFLYEFAADYHPAGVHRPPMKTEQHRSKFFFNPLIPVVSLASGMVLPGGCFRKATAQMENTHRS